VDDDVIVSENPLPDDTENYAGRWIAIRDRKVVADAETLPELRADPRVRRDDTVYAVPPPGLHFY
jgi:Family of unknown function (DUF5678)